MSDIAPGTRPDAAERYLGLSKRASQGALPGLGGLRAFVDLETTGFDADADRIIEVGVLLVRGEEVLESYEALVKPGRGIPPEIQAFTGISPGMVAADGVEPREAAETLARMLEGAEVVAFNAPFEERFLARLGSMTGVAVPASGFLDALELARIVLPRLTKHRQTDLCDLFELDEGPAHRALADARALARLYPVLLAGLDAMDPAVRRAIAALSPTTVWPLRALFAEAGRGASRGIGRPDFARWRRAVERPRKGQSLSAAEDVVVSPPDAEAVRAVFDADGALAGAGYERREGQAAMAGAVAEAFGERRHLVVEAGTGTGKSAAYLVPAIRLAAENGIRVVVSTHTTALQDQLVVHEVPRLAGALGEQVEAVVLKGYDHYLCLRRFSRLWEGAELAPAMLGLAAMLTAWVADSCFDELDSLNVHTLGSLEDQVRASQTTCLKESCRFAREGTCFMWGQRRRAAAAHILVVNHALLLANVRCARLLYPSSRYAVVDEAHHLEGQAREALAQRFGRQATLGVLGTLAGRGQNLWPSTRDRGGPATTLPDEVVEGVRARCKAVAREARDALTGVKRLFGAAVALAGDAGAARTLRLAGPVREGDAWETFTAAATDALDRLSATIHALQLLSRDALSAVAAATADPGLHLAEAAADIAGYLTDVVEGTAALEAVLAGESEDSVHWLDVQRRPGWEDEVLVAAPLDVGGALAEGLFDAHEAVVLTSATLSAGDDFRHFVTSVGLDRVERVPKRMLIASPFDYERQMRVFVATDLPEPGDQAYLGELVRFLVDLHKASGGGTLTLFTRRSDMEAVHEAVAPELAAGGLALLCQGRGAGRRRLAAEFKADANASLMATRSFWDGFDAPGDTLRAVVIARLPFGYAGDPLSEALRERVGSAAWWSRYYLPRAVLDLKQAAGRLIRTSQDSGVVVVTDSRLGDRRYAQRFLDALPVPARLTGWRCIVEQVARVSTAGAEGFGGPCRCTWE